jgi:hypothetical protein
LNISGGHERHEGSNRQAGRQAGRPKSADLSFDLCLEIPFCTNEKQGLILPIIKRPSLNNINTILTQH